MSMAKRVFSVELLLKSNTLICAIFFTVGSSVIIFLGRNAYFAFNDGLFKFQFDRN